MYDGWPAGASAPVLSHGDAHVWRIALTQPEDRVRELATLLSEKERERAARFQFDHLRQRFVVSHGALRLILSRYTDEAPEQLRFAYGSFGKPALAFECEVRFNLSHSEDLALVAVTRGREVGVDVEHVRSVLEIDQIARSNFSFREYAAFCALAQGQKLLAFFNCWTRKEAFIKALGAGLSMPLDQFDVAFAPNENARLLAIAGDENETTHWSLVVLHPAEGYAAALAVAAPKVKISCWQWQG